IYAGLIDIGAYEWNQPDAIESDDIAIPLTTTLNQNYPNPFNPSTTIQFALPNSPLTKGAGGLSPHKGVGHVSLHIYDISGRLVKTLLDNEPYQPGYHSIQWNGCNGNGATAGSGIYLYQLETVSPKNQKEVMTRRMTLLK
ncbi:MAG: hypothetical protein GY869_09000, partial [Planctomycetes bacterium]|nr:hypothetical protein [Planctomycetota bacterium]